MFTVREILHHGDYQYMGTLEVADLSDITLARVLRTSPYRYENAANNPLKLAQMRAALQDGRVFEHGWSRFSQPDVPAPHAPAGCEWDQDCTGEGVCVVGDLLVCSGCAPEARRQAHNVPDVDGTVVCRACGYRRPAGTECGEPCL